MVVNYFTCTSRCETRPAHGHCGRDAERDRERNPRRKFTRHIMTSLEIRLEGQIADGYRFDPLLAYERVRSILSFGLLSVSQFTYPGTFLENFADGRRCPSSSPIVLRPFSCGSRELGPFRSLADRKPRLALNLGERLLWVVGLNRSRGNL